MNEFKFLETKGYLEESDAREHIRLWYAEVPGVTMIQKNNRWFIVQCNTEQ